jgi:hypothetical protein
MRIPERQREIDGLHGFVDGIRYVMPVNSWNASAVIAAFPCNYAAAAALIPQGYVHPFRYFSKALLIISVIDYRETDIGAYIEYSIAIACTKGRRPALPLLPALFRRAFGTGQFVHDLPVSSEVSVKGGKGIWGMPKHQAPLDFKVGKKWVSSQYDLDGQMVSRLDVRMPSRFPWPLNTGAANYCQFRGMIMRSFIFFKGKAGVHLLKPGAARFVLGDHPRSDVLRTLEHRPEPLFAAYIDGVNGVLDDYFDCWFITAKDRPELPFGEGLETTYPLGYSREWLPPPNRDPGFDLDKD